MNFFIDLDRTHAGTAIRDMPAILVDIIGNIREINISNHALEETSDSQRMWYSR